MVAEAKRRDDDWKGAPAGSSQPWAEPAGDGHRPGGPVGRLQADLAHRLALEAATAAIPVSPGERVVRFLSVSGGYAALFAAYAGLVFLALR